jgi:hypothetical protein
MNRRIPAITTIKPRITCMMHFYLTRKLLIFSLVALCVSGHMQMSKPFPIRSPLNEKNVKKDYSYKGPLSTSGSDYPCKGYADDPFHSVATYTPGHEYEIELEGRVTHGGGSCQISLSYNKGKTFHVIHSILGECPIAKSYKFKIPTGAPPGHALLAWTWFNKIGNREMYMNCAQITIRDGPVNRDHLNNTHSTLIRRSLNNLPSIFVANVDGVGKCTTVAGQEVNFPLPGPSVEGSLSGQGYRCEESAPFLAGSSYSAGPSATSNTPISTRASSYIRHTASSDSGSCTPGDIICARDGKSWSMCANGTPFYMGSVSAGSLCRDGAIIPDTGNDVVR